MNPLAALVLIALAVTSSQTLSGTFAMQAGRPQTRAHMVVTHIGDSPLDRRLDLWQTGAGSETVSRYDANMTKSLHLIAISDDFTTFLHVHPTLGNDHHFRIDLRFPKQGLYHVYADDDPQGVGQQVFRYDIRIGAQREHERRLVPSGAEVTAGPYRVVLGATQLRVGSENELAVHITRNGNPANDLHPYLGALAHAVFIDADDLSYAHVHPMPLEGSKTGGMSQMSAMDAMADSARSSPDMMLHVRMRAPGTYKLWLQFRGSDALYAAPFVMTAS